MVSIKDELASELFSKLELAEIEVISKEIAKLKVVSSEDKEEVLEEFYQMNLARQYLEQAGRFRDMW